VTVLRPDAEPELFSQSETLSGEPHLPGLGFPVAELFADAPQADFRCRKLKAQGLRSLGFCV
jgi:hypothetical protein